MTTDPTQYTDRGYTLSGNDESDLQQNTRRVTEQIKESDSIVRESVKEYAQKLSLSDEATKALITGAVDRFWWDGAKIKPTSTFDTVEDFCNFALKHIDDRIKSKSSPQDAAHLVLEKKNELYQKMVAFAEAGLHGEYRKVYAQWISIC